MFGDRVDAGRRLARRLEHLRGGPVVVLGLPRGGVPVAAEVARALGVPLDVIVVRKLGVPFQPELGMGAVGEDGVRVINRRIVAAAKVTAAELAAVEERERAEVTRRALLYRGGRPRVPLDGKVAVIVDDGIATGSTARAACQVARALGAARVVLATPVAPPGWQDRIGRDPDEMIAVVTPTPFYSIGQFYADFSQTSDEQVVACLERAAAPIPALARRPAADPVPRPAAADPVPRPAAPDPVPAGDQQGAGAHPQAETEVEVASGAFRLPGLLSMPAGAAGVVVFAHGSGSSRHSSRNRYVASVLNQAGLGTLLFDLLTADEELDRDNVFDIGLLARRLEAATAWLASQPATAGLPAGYFGASTGAAAALLAAAKPAADIAAVVSRGGRPDLAGPPLRLVRAPTLLIVGGNDHAVLGLNRAAQAELRCENELVVIPGATHLFEEPGTLAAAARLASDWLSSHMATRLRPAR
jgi:putative phosphoribosyl transferase